jgi:hypothetical protein
MHNFKILIAYSLVTLQITLAGWMNEIPMIDPYYKDITLSILTTNPYYQDRHIRNHLIN